MNSAGRIAVLASGRGSNFEALCTSDLGGASVVLLASDNPSSGALLKARRMGVESIRFDPGPGRSRVAPEAEKSLADLLVSRSIDLVCLAGFMRILGGALLESFTGRILNIHPSLLPAFPGLHAQAQAVAHGVKVSGCTVHYVDTGTDTGPIVLQAAVPVLGSDTADSLAERILQEEHRILPEAVRLHFGGRIRIDGRIVKSRIPDSPA